MGARPVEPGQRRNPDGSIDLTFYTARAERLRRRAVTEAIGTIKRMIRDRVLSLGKLVPRRSSMP